MSVVKDIGNIWDRLFSHQGFLNGEITFVLREFEVKRKDKEVDNLFRIIENITEIKDPEITRCQHIGDQILEQINEKLEQALDTCSEFATLETNYQRIRDKAVEDARNQRKIEWDHFMDDITARYGEINSTYELKEQELAKFYEDIEKKFLV